MKTSEIYLHPLSLITIRNTPEYSVIVISAEALAQTSNSVLEYAEQKNIVLSVPVKKDDKNT